MKSNSNSNSNSNSRHLPTDRHLQADARGVATASVDHEEPTLKPAVARSKRSSKRQSDRDKHLMAVLAEARYLTTEQLGALFFLGRHSSATRRRLGILAGGGGRTAYLQRHLFAMSADPSEHGVAWSLAPAGYSLVERQLGAVHRPAHDLEAAYFEHHVLFSELLVRLLGGALARQLGSLPPSLNGVARARALANIYVRAEHPLWRWKVLGDEMELPWRAYSVGDGQTRDRVIRPDAILELVEPKRRLFIEGETGAHSIKARSSEKTGSTLAKVERYSAYVDGLSNPEKRLRWYDERFPDGYAPEVLFVVPSAARASHIQVAVSQWRAKQVTPSRLVVRAMTVDQAVQMLMPLTGDRAEDAAPSARGAVLTPAAVAVVVEFFSKLREDFKERAARARAKGVAAPPKPARYDEMKAVVADLWDAQQGRRRE